MAGTTESVTSDATLVALAEAGDDAGYEELHERHAHAAWGLAQAITRDDETALAAVSKAIPAVFAAIDRGGYPSGLPVRWAILAATRSAALSTLHSSSWTGAPYRRDPVDRAFSGLPECWRSALWLREVERLQALEAAGPLRMPPDDAAALAERARAGFTDRYLRIAEAGRDAACREVLPLLPGLAAGTLPPHQVAAVDQHVAGCRPCRTNATDLLDLGSALRAIALPAPAAALRAPAAAHLARGDLSRLIPALAALIAAVLGIASLSALAGNAPAAKQPGQQLAGPVDAAVAAREPERVASFRVLGPAPATTSPGIPSLPKAPATAPADDLVVAMAVHPRGAVPADLATPATPPPDAEEPVPATPPAPTGSSPAPDQAPPAAPPLPVPSSEDGLVEDGPAEDSSDEPASLEVTADVGIVGVTAGVTAGVDPASVDPVQVEITIPGPTVGLSALGSEA